METKSTDRRHQPGLPQCPSDTGKQGFAGIWPSQDYLSQIVKLKAAVGQMVYLLESRLPETPDGFRMADTPVELVGVVEHPKPDPAHGILPHLLLLGDGRGVNLGRIARISVTRAYKPIPEQLLYVQPEVLHRRLFGERQLSRQTIARRSKAMLGELLGCRSSMELPGEARETSKPER